MRSPALPIALLLVSVLAISAAPAAADHPSAQIESTGVIVLDPAALEIDRTTARDGVRFTHRESTEIVGEVTDSGTEWFGSDRARLGGEDAPRRILVRAFDAVFSIDPFVPLPVGNETAARVLFNGASLETDQALFNRIRIERTMELMHILEGARRRWLRDNGFFGVRAFTNPGSEAKAGEPDPVPDARFRVPPDVPRGRSIERVDAAPAAERGAALARSGERVRFSLPFGTAPDVVASVRARGVEERVASRE